MRLGPETATVGWAAASSAAAAAHLHESPLKTPPRAVARPAACHDPMSPAKARFSGPGALRQPLVRGRDHAHVVSARHVAALSSFLAGREVVHGASGQRSGSARAGAGHALRGNPGEVAPAPAGPGGR